MRKLKHTEMTYLPRVIQVLSGGAGMQTSKSGSEPVHGLPHCTASVLWHQPLFDQFKEEGIVKRMKQSAASASHFFGPVRVYKSSFFHFV